MCAEHKERSIFVAHVRTWNAKMFSFQLTSMVPKRCDILYVRIVKNCWRAVLLVVGWNRIPTRRLVRANAAWYIKFQDAAPTQRTSTHPAKIGGFPVGTGTANIMPFLEIFLWNGWKFVSGSPIIYSMTKISGFVQQIGIFGGVHDTYN